ncbi:unnamed protein product [Nezara viridula]|uniref:Uncharacterized protein n=1 Tax=Nezara viridula TaxID=85310 RepID=A0A9P0H6F9_NEZVI|nr:unnamed protein product [Nezara viridula]
MSVDHVHFSANISDFCVICRVCSLAVDFLVRTVFDTTVFGSMSVLVALLPVTRDIYRPPGLVLSRSVKSRVTSGRMRFFTAYRRACQ